MKQISILILLIFGVNIGLFAQKSTRYYDGEGMQVMIQYSGNLDQVSLIQISGKRPGIEKVVWLKTTVNNTKTTNDDGKKVKEFEVTDESGQKYRVRLYSDLVTATLSKFNPSGKVVRIWDLKGRSGANASTASGKTLVFDGDYAVKFDYDKKTKKMTNLQFSVDKARQSYSKFEVYDVENYEDGGYEGKLYTVKDGSGKKFTILYSDSFDYIQVNTVGDRTESQTTLHLKR